MRTFPSSSKKKDDEDSGRQVFRKLRTINVSPRFRFLDCLNIDHLDFKEMLIFLSFNVENKTSRNVMFYFNI